LQYGLNPCFPDGSRQAPKSWSATRTVW
jgi:hypothetical protein